MINDLTAMVLSELSYVTIDDGYNGYSLKDIINNNAFRQNHKADPLFQDFLKNYKLFPEKYDSVLSNYTLISAEHYSSNYNGLALLNNQTKEVVIASKGTDFEKEEDFYVDGQMVVSGILPQYFLDAKKFTKAVKTEIDKNYSAVNNITFTGHSLGGSVTEYLRVINEGEGRFSYDAKALEPYGVGGWVNTPVKFDVLGRPLPGYEGLVEFQEKYILFKQNNGPGSIENIINTHDPVPKIIYSEFIGTVRNLSDNGQNMDKVSKEKIDAIDGVSNLFYHKLSTYLLYNIGTDGNLQDKLSTDALYAMYNIKVQEEGGVPAPSPVVPPPMPDPVNHGGTIHSSKDYDNYVDECRKNGNYNYLSEEEYYAGDDTIYGGEGNDYIGGYGGNNAVYGGLGNDELNGSDGDYLNGGPGNDNIEAS